MTNRNAAELLAVSIAFGHSRYFTRSSPLSHQRSRGPVIAVLESQSTDNLALIEAKIWHLTEVGVT